MIYFERDNGDGYIGKAMSIRAKRAYDSGEKPKSKWTKQNILEEIYNETDSDYIYSCLKKVSAKDLFENCFRRSSWHHTGMFYNETNFYQLDLEKLIDYLGKLAAEDKIDYNKIELDELRDAVKQSMFDYEELMSAEKKEKLEADEIRQRLLAFDDKNYIVGMKYRGNKDVSLKDIDKAIKYRDWELVESDIFVLDKNKLSKELTEIYESDELLQEMRETSKTTRTQNASEDGDIDRWIEEIKERNPNGPLSDGRDERDCVIDLFMDCRRNQNMSDAEFVYFVLNGWFGEVLGYKDSAYSECKLLKDILNDCIEETIWIYSDEYPKR